MEGLFGFLIGLAFPVVTYLVSFAMIAGGAEQGEPAKAMALITLIGIAAWIAIFVGWGVPVGLMALLGWVVGIGVALLIAKLTLNIRRKQLGFKDFDS